MHWRWGRRRMSIQRSSEPSWATIKATFGDKRINTQARWLKRIKKYGLSKKRWRSRTKTFSIRIRRSRLCRHQRSPWRKSLSQWAIASAMSKGPATIKTSVSPAMKASSSNISSSQHLQIALNPIKRPFLDKPQSQATSAFQTKSLWGANQPWKTRSGPWRGKSWPIKS